MDWLFPSMLLLQSLGIPLLVIAFVLFLVTGMKRPTVPGIKSVAFAILLVPALYGICGSVFAMSRWGLSLESLQRVLTGTLWVFLGTTPAVMIGGVVGLALARLIRRTKAQ
jgi:hypothetical protein